MSYKTIRLSGAPEFTPRDYQEEFLEAIQKPEARAIAVWPRRTGKDTTTLHNEVVAMHERKGMYWHCDPVYEQARKSVWQGRLQNGELLMESVFPRSIRKYPREWAPHANMTVETTNGSVWLLIGSDTINSVLGSNPLGITYSEFALNHPHAWDLARPILRENGGWAAFVSTPRGRNHLWSLIEKNKNNPKWFYSFRTLYHLMPKDEVEEILREEFESGMPQELINQEYLCDFSAALVGSYYGDLLAAMERRGAMEAFEHERDNILAVFDLGISDSTAIWLLRVSSGSVDFVGHYEENGKPMSHYFDWLDGVEEGIPKKLGFKYAGFFFPHDAKARTLQTGGTIIEQAARRYGTGKCHIVPNVSLLDGIQAARWLLQQNVRFHPRCNGKETQYGGIEALKQYHKEWDQEQRCFSLHPEHDWSSHTADAFRYASLIIRLAKQMSAGVKKVVSLEEAKSLPSRGCTMDEMWKSLDTNKRRKRI